MSKPYAEVIGDPIAHSKSPLIHNFWLQKLGIDAEYRATHVKADELEGYFETRRADPDWRGCNVTSPHKQAALTSLDEEDQTATWTGAVNTVYPDGAALVGHNSDLRGVAMALHPGSDMAEGSIVALLGAGGAARAALAHCAVSQVIEVRVVARNSGKARQLLETFKLDGHGLELTKANIAFDGADFVINATPLGMAGQSPMPATVMRAISESKKTALIFDMVYSPLETDFLKAATAFGRKTADGLTMLVEQAREAFFLLFANELAEYFETHEETALREFDTELRRLLTQ